jgi:hypothetical protein
MAGYSKLASFMTEKHYPTLRTYRHLAVRDLLYLQAELCHLEYKYNSVAKKDAAVSDERQYYDRDWLHLKLSEHRGFCGEQWTVAVEIRAKLQEYCKFSSFQSSFHGARTKITMTNLLLDSAILQYSQIASLSQPSDSERSLLHDWIGSSALGGACGFLGRDLGGFEQSSVYETIYQKDLVILSDNHGENDLFTRFISGPLLVLFHRVWRHTRVFMFYQEVQVIMICDS